MLQPRIALFARYPTPGRCKTRLVPALGPQGAADIHRRLVERTLDTIRASGLPFTVWITGADAGAFHRWLGRDVNLQEQGSGDLGDRLARVPAPMILLGADIPDLTAEHLRQAAAALQHAPFVIGPAEDGGYYLLGCAKPAPYLFVDMAWGGDTVALETRRRIAARGLDCVMLDPRADLDRPEDLPRWPDLIP
ncbi:TIGR04282 family arsenosugar biosynthesis glycosyltransferase [Pseudopontixanthobacter vadosimaris]|uniref:TIGR04282 family arsenosugar biosynthesis glycosyltransferase n=1 Tax=Pseudopontixanthobacter vadosimaris TaxID=2726450 RepID=UPI00147321D6|nr:TIGR04282 family arsenosugar biosynthesis glycosyltransferase [Pseudopontixanthobacter vadosimaris]